MRKAIFLASSGLLAGCATVPPPVVAATCHDDALSAFVGQKGSAETGSAMIRASGADVIRWLPLGAMATMEFRADRLTVHLGASGEILSASCG